MIASRSSLEDLNRRIGSDFITMDNFRPNIVVKGCLAFDEDTWSYIKIGEEVLFRVVKPCERYVLNN